MSTLNVSLPEQLKRWIAEQITTGRYSSASDYLRDLIREDIRHQEEGTKWLANHLKPLVNTPDDKFVFANADDIKMRARHQIKG